MDLITLIIKFILSIVAGLVPMGPVMFPLEYDITNTVIDTPEETKPESYYGSDGHLYIPDANISVALQREDGYQTMQGICDDPDMACYISYEDCDFLSTLFDGTPMIADHNYQGFNGIKTLKIGAPLYIEYPDKTVEYKLEYIDPNGTYDYADVTYLNSTFPLEWPRYSDGSFVNKNHTDCVTLYTCNQDNRHITIARFKKQ